MAAGARPAPRTPGFGSWSPFRLTWGLLTNVKFALVLVGTAVVASLIGVIVPQMPGPMRRNESARSAWLEIQRAEYGMFFGPMERLEFFELFYSTWFIGLWVVIIVAVTVCTVSRLRPTARSVHQPPKRVSERYFETAHYRAAAPTPLSVEQVEAKLKARHYRVWRAGERDGATYLFADRYPWASYGTFISHLALLILLIGGVLTVTVGFDVTLALSETTSPVPAMRSPGPGQVFVQMLDAVKGVDERGNVIDFRSHLLVRQGPETIQCTTTVNDPCQAFGYRLHQAAFFDDVARVRIEAPDGRSLYDDVIDFNNAATRVPVIRVTDGNGAVVMDEPIPQMGIDTGRTAARNDDLALSEVLLPGGEVVTLGWRQVEGELLAVVATDEVAVRRFDQGDRVQVGEYDVEFAGAKRIPAREINDLPGAIEGRATVQMLTATDGTPYLYILGLGESAGVIRTGETYEAESGFRFTFNGRVEAAGINIRRDPGDTFIWIAVIMAMVGLGVTFYLPKRRLWVRITPERTYFAGIAEKTARYDRELEKLSRELMADGK